MSVVETYQYPDPEDAFSRDPFVVKFSAPSCSEDMLFLGDFNADCNYVRAQDWAAIRLRSSEIFKWLIPDSADTTVGNSDCAYNRIVVCGAEPICVGA